MPILVVCSNCATKLNAPDTAAGKKVKCPKCQAICSVSGVAAAPTPAPDPAFEIVDDAPPPKPKPAPATAPLKAQSFVKPAANDDEDSPRAKKPSPSGQAADTGKKKRYRDDDDDDAPGGRPRARGSKRAGLIAGGIGATFLALMIGGAIYAMNNVKKAANDLVNRQEQDNLKKLYGLDGTQDQNANTKPPAQTPVGWVEYKPDGAGFKAIMPQNVTVEDVSFPYPTINGKRMIASARRHRAVDPDGNAVCEIYVVQMAPGLTATHGLNAIREVTMQPTIGPKAKFKARKDLGQGIVWWGRPGKDVQYLPPGQGFARYTNTATEGYAAIIYGETTNLDPEWVRAFLESFEWTK